MYDQKLDDNTTAYTLFLEYRTKILGAWFGDMLPQNKIKNGYFYNTVRSKMVKSPDENYYYKAYEGSNAF